jgi:hypothetical protein
MNLAEVKRESAIEKLTQLDMNDIRLLWHSGYWDGALTGLLLYEGCKYWFENYDDPEATRRRYLVIELTDEELWEAEYWHELFREKVGTHTDYADDGRHRSGSVKPKDRWNEFYEPFQKRVPADYSENTVIGWFEY